MIRRRSLEGVPADYVAGDFPDAEVAAGAPEPARYARAVALNLRRALEGRSLSQTCRDADLSRSTVQDLLAGPTWPDLITLAKLEVVLDVTVWPDRAQLS